MNLLHIKQLLPGIVLTMIIAFLAKIIPIPVVNELIIAISLGALYRFIGWKIDLFELGIKFTMKRLLKIAIMMLGVSLSINSLFVIGSKSFLIITLVVTLGLICALLLSKMLKVDLTLGTLIGAGSSICGATAIMSVKSAVQAKEAQTAYAITTIFLFNLLSIILYPYIGELTNMSQSTFGLWAGATIQDMSSAVAVGYAYGQEAGETATVVKLVRVLYLIPLLIILQMWFSKKDEQTDKHAMKKVTSVVPWFILGFIAMSVIGSVGMISIPIKSTIVEVGKFILIMVMAGVGFQLEGKQFKSLGIKPLVVGFITSFMLSFVTFIILSIQ